MRKKDVKKMEKYLKQQMVAIHGIYHLELAIIALTQSGLVIPKMEWL